MCVCIIFFSRTMLWMVYRVPHDLAHLLINTMLLIYTMVYAPVLGGVGGLN